MRVEELKTPAFLIDLPKLKRNCRAMLDRAAGHGVRLRPHVKTHKTAEVARIQTGGGSGAIAVSTLAEARFFLEAGFRDITYAFPITPGKLEGAFRLSEQAESFQIILDSEEAADAVEAFCRHRGCRLRVLLKVDPGYRRAGVDPGDPASLALARRLHESSWIEFEGVLTHAGQSYRCRDRGEIAAVAEEERAVVAGFAAQAEARGVPCPTRSAGSTPAAVAARSWEGVNEIRPGNYVFFDRHQADIGACGLEECAASVLCAVAGRYPRRNRILIDAGSLALSKDPGAVHVRKDESFGAVAGHPDMRVVSLSQEHGFLEADEPIRFEDFPIGSLVRIIPNHSCLTAALFPEYHVVMAGEVVDRWIPVRGW